MKRQGLQFGFRLRFKKLGVVIAALIITAMSTGGRPAAKQTIQEELPSVDRILEKYVQALGGESAFRKLTTQVLTGTMEMRTAKEIISPRSDLTGNFEI